MEQAAESDHILALGAESIGEVIAFTVDRA